MSRSINKRSKWFALMIGLTVAPRSAWAGTCALCRQALASGANAGLIHGFYWSILLIAGMPLVMMTVIGVIVWRQRSIRSACDESKDQWLRR